MVPTVPGPLLTRPRHDPYQKSPRPPGRGLFLSLPGTRGVRAAPARGFCRATGAGRGFPRPEGGGRGRKTHFLCARKRFFQMSKEAPGLRPGPGNTGGPARGASVGANLSCSMRLRSRCGGNVGAGDAGRKTARPLRLSPLPLPGSLMLTLPRGQASGSEKRRTGLATSTPFPCTGFYRPPHPFGWTTHGLPCTRAGSSYEAPAPLGFRGLSPWRFFHGSTAILKVNCPQGKRNRSGPFRGKNRG